jgi:TetR/AcrR family transcriptional regulator, cholesterol catabolism regulator
VRHARVIQATMELAAHGGYEAVQMRDVAAHADVALGTLYRHFSSKNHLLVAALAEWTGELQQRLAQRPARGETAPDRVIDTLRRATRTLERAPAVTSALVTALTSLSADDPKALKLANEVYDTIAEIISDAMRNGDAEQHDDAIRVLSQVWFAALVAWVRGWSPAGAMIKELEMATRLLVRA